MAHFKQLLMTTAIFAVTIHHPTHAGEVEDTIIDKMVEAYGGKKFETLKSITIYNDLRFGWLGQGHTADLVELEPMRKIYDIDLIGMRGSEDAWGGRGGYSERIIGTNDGQTTINYMNNTYSEDTEANFYSHFGAEMRGSDTLMAYDLMKNRAKAVHKGQTMYLSSPHDIIEYDMEGTSYEPQLWIDSKTGYISRISRDVPNNKWHYVFDSHKTADGITYADDFALYSGDKMVEYTKSRSLKVNRVKESMFQIDKGIAPEPESYDTSEITVDELAPGFHYAGQHAGFSAFIDAGDHIIGVGGYGGLKERFEAYQAAHGGDKPLRYQIVTHHHTDHLAGIADALELGAILVTPPSAVANIKKVAGEPIAGDRLQIIDDKKTSVGPVDVHIISTTHAQEYALAYVPSVKAVYQADHYNGSYKNQGSPVNHAAMSMKTEIERLGLDVDYLYSAHTRKAEPWAVFEAMSKTYVAGPCPTGRKICRDLK
ncbi:MAG: hypothetical protein ACPGVT_08320 [Maricaulaceae bacterium]